MKPQIMIGSVAAGSGIHAAAGHDGGDFFIVEDFINAVRDNKQPELDVYKACEWSAVGLLSGISVANKGRTIEVPHFRPNAPVEEKIIKL